MGRWAWLRWLGAATSDLPSVRVRVRSASGEGRTELEAQLCATSRSFEVVRLTARADEAEVLGLTFPANFTRAPDETPEEGPALRVAVPRERVVLRPDRPEVLVFEHAPGVDRFMVVRGWAEAAAGPGGSGLSFGLPVGTMSVLEAEAWNLRSRIYAEARESGSIPRDHPDWPALEELESRLSTSQ